MGVKPRLLALQEQEVQHPLQPIQPANSRMLWLWWDCAQDPTSPQTASGSYSSPTVPQSATQVPFF